MRIISPLSFFRSKKDASPPPPVVSKSTASFGDVPAEIWAKHLIYKHLILDVRTMTALGGIDKSMRALVFDDCRDAWLYAAGRASGLLRRPNELPPDFAEEKQTLLAACRLQFSTIDTLAGRQSPHAQLLGDSALPVSFSPNGGWAIQIPDLVRTRPWEKTQKVEVAWFSTMASQPIWSPDGSLAIATKGAEVNIYSMDAEAGRMHELEHIQDVYSATCCWSPDGDLLASVGRRSSSFILHTSPSKVAARRNEPFALAKQPIAVGDMRLRTLRWSRSGEWLACASDDHVAVVDRSGQQKCMMDMGAAHGRSRHLLWANDRELVMVSEAAFTRFDVTNFA